VSIDTTTNDQPVIAVTNNGTVTTSNAVLSTTFQVDWTPSYSGQTPPSSVIVTVANNYSFAYSGTGSCSIVDASSTVQDSTASGSSLVENGLASYWTEPTRLYYTVSLTPQTDGSAIGTFTTVGSTLSATYDSSTNAATTVTETPLIESFNLPASPLLAQAHHPKRQGAPRK